METYITSGTCAKEIRFEIEKDYIKNVEFVKGCPGNLLGITQLVKDQKVDDVITRLSGIPCGNKDTSCPDQLAQALIAYKTQQTA